MSESSPVLYLPLFVSTVDVTLCVSYIPQEAGAKLSPAGSWSKRTPKKTDVHSVPERLLDRRPELPGCDWWGPEARPSPANTAVPTGGDNHTAPPLPRGDKKLT